MSQLTNTQDITILPKVSICLPVYNGERYLAAAIESALTQTFSDFELLISDDCSSDSSAQIIEEYASKDKRIKHWRNDPNLGLFANYNECMRRAEGTYIKLFAQDDLFDQSLLERMVQEIEANSDVALISCARRLVDENSTETRVVRAHDHSIRQDYAEVLKANLLELKNVIGEPSTVIFPRSLIGTGFDANYYHLGDIEYWFRIIGKHHYYYLDEVLCSFRTHSQSTTSKNAKGLRFAVDMVKLGRVYREFIEEAGLSEEDYARLVAEATATHVKYLSRHQGITLKDLLSIEHESIESMKEDLAAFKEILFYTLLIAGESLEENYALKREWEAERNKLENNIAKVLSSKSWKITTPLRGAFKILKQ